MGKKILFVTTRLFWPADSGRKVMLYHYCKGLCEQLGFEIYLFSFLESGQGYSDVESRPSFIRDVRLANPISRHRKVCNVLKALPDRGAPLQNALYWSEENRAALRSYCAEVLPDFGIIDMIRLAPYMDAFSGYECPVILDFDDLLSKRYERQAGNSGGDVLGKYSSQASGLLNRLMASSAVKKTVLLSESKRVRICEEQYARLADAVLFVSPIEARELNERIGSDKCFCATMGAGIVEKDDRLSHMEYDFGFVGNMGYGANQASLDLICIEVLPRLPGTSMRVVGVCPEEVKERYARFNQLSFSGRVESISDELLKCKVMLVPFAYGTGIKTKVLEAMGMGIPVVTNSIGLEGLTCVPGNEIEIGETPEELAQLAAGLLTDSERRLAVSNAGKAYVCKNHDWRNSIQDFGKCLEYAERNFGKSE